MFDFAWSEIAVIAAVALVVIGPKDLPVALRAISGFVKKARRMAGEFQTHVDEMMREADLKDVKDSLNEIRNFDFRGTVEKAIDPDRTLRDTFASNPLDPTPAGAGALPAGEAHVSEPVPDEYEPEPEPLPPARVAAPSFIPPALVPFVDGPKPPEPPPSFIPPPFAPASLKPDLLKPDPLKPGPLKPDLLKPDPLKPEAELPSLSFSGLPCSNARPSDL
jgi:sec-independent protein translocase protein TatB